MSDCKTVRLGDVATYINGYAFKPSDWGTEGLPIIRIQNLTGNDYETNFYNGKIPEKYFVKNGDVLISWSASLGVYEWKKNDALLNQHIFKVVFDKLEVDKKYFMFTVSNLLNAMSKQTHGSTMRHITKPDFDNMPFPLPPIEKQKQIARKLDKCNELILKNNRILEKYDLLIKSRFIEMFGDPVQNPMGWEKTELGNMCKEVRYGTSKPATENGIYTYLRMNNITFEGELDLANTKTIDISDEELPKCSVQKGDILFNRTNSIELCGKTCLYKLDETMVIAGYIIRVRVNEKLNPQYVSTFFNTKSIKKLLREMAKGAVNQANINAQEMQSIQIPVPPIALQNEYDGFVQQIDKSKFAVQKSLEKAETLFKSLMQEYFN